MRILLVGLLIALCTIAKSELVVVVSKQSEIDSLNSQEIANIFLARTNRFPNGQKTEPIELREKEIRSNFYASITGKSPKQLSAYWTTLVFTGKGRPPKRYQDLDDLIEVLENNPGKITYLDRDQVTDSMKIIFDPSQM